MIPIREVYPGEIKPNGKTGWGVYDYKPLVYSMGFDVVLMEDVGGYQGDSLVVLRDGGRFGFMVFGWGSCSHCDALQACDTADEVAALRDELFRSIIWHESAEELRAFLTARDWEAQHYWGREAADFVERAVALLEVKP